MLLFVVNFSPIWLFIFVYKIKQSQKIVFYSSPICDLLELMIFNHFLIILKFHAPKITVKYSKNAQKFTTKSNTVEVLIRVYQTLCKKPHLSEWSGLEETFLLCTRYKQHWTLVYPRKSQPEFVLYFFLILGRQSNVVSYKFVLRKKKRVSRRH